MQIKDALHQQFPHLEIGGGNYPTPASKVLTAQLVQVLQLGLIGVAVAGDYVFTHLLNYPPNGPFPPLYEQIREKRMFVGMGAWLVGNSVTQGLTSSGAFEIYFNGQVVSSKLNPASAAFYDAAYANPAASSGGGGVPSLQFIIQQMHRIDPTLSSVRRRMGAGAGAYPPAHARPAASASASASTNPRARPSAQPHTHDDDVNRDVRDLSYEDDI